MSVRILIKINQVPIGPGRFRIIMQAQETLKNPTQKEKEASLAVMIESFKGVMVKMAENPNHENLTMIERDWKR
jgi:hypothetical protein